jgi:hypothetical protein
LPSINTSTVGFRKISLNPGSMSALSAMHRMASRTIEKLMKKGASRRVPEIVFLTLLKNAYFWTFINEARVTTLTKTARIASR